MPNIATKIHKVNVKQELTKQKERKSQGLITDTKSMLNPENSPESSKGNSNSHKSSILRQTKTRKEPTTSKNANFYSNFSPS